MSETRRWVAVVDQTDVDLFWVGAGQKLAALSMLVYFVAAALAQHWGETSMSLYLAIWGMVMGVFAVWLVGKGLDFPLWSRALAVLCLFIPLANFVILLSMSVRATSALRQAGYDVGLFGAR
jgi:hypothetical protein